MPVGALIPRVPVVPTGSDLADVQIENTVTSTPWHVAVADGTTVIYRSSLNYTANAAIRDFDGQIGEQPWHVRVAGLTRGGQPFRTIDPVPGFEGLVHSSIAATGIESVYDALQKGELEPTQAYTILDQLATIYIDLKENASEPRHGNFQDGLVYAPETSTVYLLDCMISTASYGSDTPTSFFGSIFYNDKYAAFTERAEQVSEALLGYWATNTDDAGPDREVEYVKALQQLLRKEFL